MKFKKGDIITATEYGLGFEKAIVLRTVVQNGKQYYSLKIMNGTATIPISAESNYKILKGNNKM